MEVEQQNVPVEISCVDMEYAPQDSGCGQQLLIFAETNSLGVPHCIVCILRQS